MYKMILKANGQKHEHDFADKVKAHEELLKIRNFPYSIEGEIWYNGTMIEWLNHSPLSVKRGDEYEG